MGTKREGAEFLAVCLSLLMVVSTVAGFVALGSGVGAAVTAPPLSACTTIDTAGVYELGGDVDGSGSAVCLSIQASDVVLDGNGFAVNGSGAGTGVRINDSGSGSVSNVTVRDVTLRGWDTGLSAQGGTGVTVKGVTALGNDIGFELRNVARMDLTDVATTNRGFETGVLVAEASGVTVTRLTSTQDGNGVAVWRSSNVTVRESAFVRPNIAVDVNYGSDVVVRDNTVEDGTIASVYSTGARPNRFVNNTASVAARNGECSGFSLSQAANDVIANNTFTECYSGAYLQKSSGITVANNRFVDITDVALTLSAGDGHVVLDNEIVGGGVTWEADPGLYLRSTKRATLAGNVLSGNAVNLRVDGYSFPELSHTIYPNNTVEGRPVAYHVNESNVVVDPNAGFVGLVGTDDATVADVTFPENNYKNVYLWRATDTLVKNVTATDGWVALWISGGSERTRVVDSTFDRAGYVELSRSPATHIVDTTIRLGQANTGVDLYMAPDTVLDNVTITDADLTAITTDTGDGSQNLTVRGSTIRDNGGGMLLTSRSLVENSVVRNNRGTGIRVQRNSHNVTVVGTRVVDNAGDGVDFGSSTRDNDVAGNTISDNDGTAIVLGQLGSGDVVTDNVVTGNAVGLAVPRTYDNLTVYDNRLNNTVNVDIDDPTGLTNATWNVSERAGPNVVGGASVGGNYYAAPDGSGVSQTCGDADDDGFCDSSYALAPNHTDFLPLTLAAVASTGPDIAVSPTSVDFGSVDVGQTTQATVTVTNDGDADLSVTDVSLSGTNASEFAESAGSFLLAPGASRDLTVEFAPTGDGSMSASLDIASNDSDESTVDISLQGTGQTVTASGLDVTPTSLDFGTTTVGTGFSLSVGVFNDGTAPVTVDRVVLDGADAGQFAIQQGLSFTLAPGEPRDVTVTYSPSAAGTHDATLRFLATDRATIAAVPLSGAADGLTTPVDPFEITDCGPITSAGYYRLANNITDSTVEVCIDVRADDVTIDGRGHWIRGGLSGTTTAVAVEGSRNATGSYGLTDVGVQNVTLADWSAGVQFRNATGFVEDVDVREGRYGVLVAGSDVAISRSTFDVFSGGFFEPGTGISIGEDNGTDRSGLASDVTLFDVTVTGSPKFGIGVSHSDLDATNVTVQKPTSLRNPGVYAESASIVMRNASLSQGTSSVQVTDRSYVRIEDSEVGQVMATSDSDVSIYDSRVASPSQAVISFGESSIWLRRSEFLAGDVDPDATGLPPAGVYVYDGDGRANVDVKDTTIRVNGTSGLYLDGAELDMDRTTITNASTGVNVTDRPIYAFGPEIDVADSHLNASYIGVRLSGQEAVLENTSIEVDDSFADGIRVAPGIELLAREMSITVAGTFGTGIDSDAVGFFSSVNRSTVTLEDSRIAAESQGVDLTVVDLTVVNTTFVADDGLDVGSNSTVRVERSRFVGDEGITGRPRVAVATLNDFSETDLAIDFRDAMYDDYEQRFDAPLNYYGPDCPDGKIDGNVTNVTPFLTAPPSDIDVSGDIQAFGYCLDFTPGKAYAFGTPAPLADNLSTVFSDFQGAVYLFDAHTQSWSLASGDEVLGAMDAVVLVPTNDTAAVVDFADATPAIPTSKQLSTVGWHFLAPRMYADAEEAFSTRTVGLTDLVQPFGIGDGPGSLPQGVRSGRYTFLSDRTSTGASWTPTVSPFTGYFVYVDDPGVVPGAVPVGVSADEADSVLIDNSVRGR